MVRATSVAALLCLGIGVDAACTPRPPANCDGVNALNPRCASKEVAYKRDVFWVGGRDINNTAGMTASYDQIYVEKLTPTQTPQGRAPPLVFFHGGGISGATWLNTPDGREGWASYFLSKGYPVYIVDAASVGRSTQNDISLFDSLTTPMRPASAAELISEIFAAPEKFNDYPQAKLHTQFPGTGLKGDPVFDLFRRSFLPLSGNLAAAETSMRASGCELLRLLGTKAFLISHSLGSRAPMLMTNDCPQYIAGNINLEAAMTPFINYNTGLGHVPSTPWGLTVTKVDYEPPVTIPELELATVLVGNETIGHRDCMLQREPARKLPKINSVPFFMITSEASVHITYDHCIIDYLKQAGGQPEWVKLADVGVHGNGHFMHQEKNNIAEIVPIVEKWIEKQRFGPRK